MIILEQLVTTLQLDGKVNRARTELGQVSAGVATRNVDHVLDYGSRHKTGIRDRNV